MNLQKKNMYCYWRCPFFPLHLNSSRVLIITTVLRCILTQKAPRIMVRLMWICTLY